MEENIYAELNIKHLSKNTSKDAYMSNNLDPKWKLKSPQVVGETQPVGWCEHN
jgi:hypothetical protein